MRCFPYFETLENYLIYLSYPSKLSFSVLLATIKQFQLLLWYQLKNNNMQSKQASTGLAQPVSL